MPDPVAPSGGESIEVVPSADNGNVPAEVPPTPSEPPKEPATPTVPVEPVKPTEPELFELPDGRKVDAITLTKEWKDNFLPEYTRKSQALAAKETPPVAPLQTPPTQNNPYADPSYVPKSYEEIIAVAEARALQAIEAKEQQRVEARQALENEVATQLDNVKKLDPNVNENALFMHATKYNFRDLGLAYQNMKDMNDLAKKVQTTTVQNINKRTDPVSVTPGATGARSNPSSFSSAQDFLRSIKS